MPRSEPIKLGVYPREFAARPVTQPSERGWQGTSRRYQGRRANPSDLVIIADATGPLRAGSRALTTLIGLCTWYYYAQRHELRDASFDGTWTEINLAALHRSLGREQKARAYQRTVEDVKALRGIAYTREWISLDVVDDETKRVEKVRHQIGGSIVSDYHITMPEDDGSTPGTIRFALGAFLREQIERGTLIVSLDLIRELRGNLAVTLAVWLRYIAGTPSVRREKEVKIGLDRLWELFPLADERPKPKVFRERIDIALNELAKVGFLRDHGWHKTGWDQVVTVRFNAASPHFQKQSPEVAVLPEGGGEDGP